MSNPVKKLRQGEKSLLKSRELQRNMRLPVLQVAALSHSKARSSGVSRSPGLHAPKDTSRQRSESDLSSEASELEKFSITYRDQRCFSSHPLQKLFSEILMSLVKNRLCSDWIDVALPESVLRVLICLRLLIRDPHHQYMEHVTVMYISCGEQAFAVQKLVTMTYMFQKLSAVEDQRVWVIDSGAHRTLVKLLSTTDSSVLLGALLALTTLAESPECKEKIGELPIVENLLLILQEYDLLSKRLLSPVWQVREQLRGLEGLPVLLSLLNAQHLKLLWSVAWVLVQLCEDPDTRAEIRSWGGDRQYICDRSSIETLSSANAAGRIHREHIREELSPQEEEDNTMALQSACCTVLTELSLDDTSAHHIVQLFIDVGHYVRDLTAYEGLQTKVSLYTEEEVDSLKESIETVDQNRPPLKVINGYSILDHLGTGAFGSVFKVRKQSGQNLLALKEVNLHNPVFGKDKKSRDSNVEKIISELTIIKEQANECMPLAEHFNSLKEKQQKFTEDRLWNVFIQMCLALRYLHMEKRIVHRDLSPNNIMLGEKDKVTITDFGLAKQKQENSKLTSVVGTILTPEVVKNEPYGEKADVWALGCILYQMATLQPPFYSTNMLSLASKIVGAVYEPIEEGAFSERVTDMIRWCLSPDPDQRPDIVAVSSRISDLMMRLMDGLYTSQNALERRAERDRKRAQKYFLERHKSKTNCCHSNPSQEKYLINTEYPTPRSSGAGSSNYSEQDEASDGDDEQCNTSITKGKHYGLTSSARVTPDRNQSSGDSAAANIKPRPVSVGICVSQKKVRQIDDPIQRLLVQLHKIIYITQLPPAPHHNIKRRVIERFKKSLFHFGSDPYNLKVQLSKLLQASPELMELGSASSDWWPLLHHFSGEANADSSDDGNLKDGVTYQQMQGIIEELLEENSYYESTQQ
ncbi:hypothetical protein F7725_018311, partial [Dissostichus mawsoni]